MSTNVWDGNYTVQPTGSQSLAYADDEIRNLKANVLNIVTKEHEFKVGSDSTIANNIGRSRPGSAKVYVQSALPVTRPDGSFFAVGSEGDGISSDAGRLWYKTNSDTVSDNTAAKIFIRGDFRFGMYVLTNVGDSFYWVPMDSECRGSVKTWLGDFENPSSNAWYTSGTMPGWFVLQKDAYTLTGVPGYSGPITLPAIGEGTLMGMYPTLGDGLNTSKLSSLLKDRAAGAGGITIGGSNEVAVTAANLPEHWHMIDGDSVRNIGLSTPGKIDSADLFGDDAFNAFGHLPDMSSQNKIAEVAGLVTDPLEGRIAVQAATLALGSNPLKHDHNFTVIDTDINAYGRTERTLKSENNNDVVGGTPLTLSPRKLQFSILVRLY